jgi:5-methylcytosine-specific restriction enzyme subunit McrC
MQILFVAVKTTNNNSDCMFSTLSEIYSKGMAPSSPPGETTGRTESLSLLFDMNRLFEGFAAAILRRLWIGSGCQVVTQGPQRYFARAGDGEAFRMRPDVTVSTADGTTVLIGDAKWKAVEGTTGAGFGVASYS